MADDLDMWNWSRLVHGRVNEGGIRVVLLLREIAEKLESETAFLLTPSKDKPGIWTIPEGWVYSEKGFPADFSISEKENIIEEALSEESVVLDTKLGEDIPVPLAKLNIESAIAAAVGYPKREALLLVCNSKKEFGRPPFQVHYANASRELAMVMARVITLDGVGDFIKQLKVMGSIVVDTDIWMQEKEELLKTHPGWFVAYQHGKRVALERSLDQLAIALDKKLGRPRTPCEFHEIIERPGVGRGPSPRLWPVDAKE